MPEKENIVPKFNSLFLPISPTEGFELRWYTAPGEYTVLDTLNIKLRIIMTDDMCK